MKKLVHKVMLIITFVISTLITLILFYNLNTYRMESFVRSIRKNFSLTTTLTANAISYGYFQWDDLYYAVLDDNQEELEEYFSEIRELSSYVEDIRIIEKKIGPKGTYFFIKNLNGDLFLDFLIYNGVADDYLNNKYVQIKLDASKILNDVQDPIVLILSQSEKDENFIYDLKVKSVILPILFFQIISAMMAGLLITILFDKLIARNKHFFYESRGLEKIIFLFEKTEKFSANHSRKVASISTYLGKKYGFKGRKLKDLKIAAFLHDIGKISVPVEILNKTGKLNKDEFGAIKKHVIFSAEIIENFEELAHLKHIILCHHEKIDGSGYPSGLKGDEIPLESKIIAIADIFEALIGVRPYRDTMNPGEALKMMEKMPLDKTIFALLQNHHKEIIQIINDNELSHTKGFK
ncbi:MAG: HD domain-containing protein [Spirochaetaceae bacterium]|nr:HD domain-containing protein [Spirochaetaceae bacterium]